MVDTYREGFGRSSLLVRVRLIVTGGRVLSPYSAARRKDRVRVRIRIRRLRH